LTPDVSVIIPAHNSMRTIRRCIESVLDQSIGRDKLDIIIVDDGSTDGTVDLLTGLAEHNKDIRLLHLQGTGGPSAPRNTALDIAAGRYVFFLDHDDYLGPEALERLVEMADTNDSDVVLGKIVGVGGRRAPRTMFERDQPSAGLFTSRVYWTLSPMKLFRREMIERVGLRFPLLAWGEDQPFVAEAYLNARNISVLASYECVYWRQPADHSNLMRSTPRLSDRIACPAVMFPLIASYVAPGFDRDLLVGRHFDVGLWRVVLPALANESDRQARRAAFQTLQGWVRDYFTAGVARELMPVQRVAYALVRRGWLAALVGYMRLMRIAHRLHHGWKRRSKNAPA
jgi:poly(ribitol-phosphate) beta-N-acetylglucosaminyltransferase